MDKELKSIWIAALRSGEYKQTKGVLKNDEGYCCLGVLCDLYDNSMWSENDSGSFRYDYELYTIPSIMRDLFGLPVDIANNLAEHNDGSPSREIRAHTFEEIANIIEQDERF